MLNPAERVALARDLDALLRKLHTDKPGRPRGWASSAEHIQTHAYLASLLEKFHVVLGGTTPATPDEYRPNTEHKYSDGGVMLLAQQIAQAFDGAGLHFNVHHPADVMVARSLLDSLEHSLISVSSKP